jgi:hypothetical protein
MMAPPLWVPGPATFSARAVNHDSTAAVGQAPGSGRPGPDKVPTAFSQVRGIFAVTDDRVRVNTDGKLTLGVHGHRELELRESEPLTPSMRTGKSRCRLVLMIRPSESSPLPPGPCRRTWTGSTNLRGLDRPAGRRPLGTSRRTALAAGPGSSTGSRRGRRRNRGHPVQGGYADRLYSFRPRAGHGSESTRPRRMHLVAAPPEARPAGRTLADVLVPKDEDECRNDRRRAYAPCSPGTLRPPPWTARREGRSPGRFRGIVDA